MSLPAELPEVVAGDTPNGDVPSSRWTLKMHRLNAGLTQAKLAARADRAMSTIYAIERGLVIANPATMKAIADVLGVQVMDVEEFYQAATNDQAP